MSRKEFHLLLQRYLRNESTKEESELIEQWYELLDDDSVAPIDETEINELETRIWQRLQLDEQQPAVVVPFYKKQIFKWVAAACILFVIAAGAWQFINRDSAETLYASLNEGEYKEQKNNTGSVMNIALEDGSSVTLDPGAAIKYPVHFAAATREVYLKGNAFFKVSKNAARPFYVFSNHTVTHVLGTSFYVTTGKNNEVEVAVKTGRVEVYEGNTTTLEPAKDGVVLTPNQKAVFNNKEKHFAKGLVEKPQPLLIADSITTEQKFVYEDASLEKVLDALSNTYGIEIVVENENLNNCPFTGDITQQDLYTKLEIICQVIKASYEVKGTTIIIRGKGC